jgi:tRNA-guanine family transglycosylase
LDLGIDRGPGNTPKYWETLPQVNTAMFNALNIMDSPIYNRVLNQGIHEYTGFPGIAFCDSGGYTMRGRDMISQKAILEFQVAAGFEMAATLDSYMPGEDEDLVGPTSSTKNAVIADQIRDPDMMLYASIQGTDPLLVSNSIAYLEKRCNFDGYALGGLIPQRNKQRTLVKLVLRARRLSGRKALHVFGLGGPSTIPLLVYLGVDTFDSSCYIVAGSRRTYFIPGRGGIDIRAIPTEELPCVCEVCSRHSTEEVRSSRALMSIHNLAAIHHEIKIVKQAIWENRVDEYLGQRLADRPVLLKAYEYAKVRTRMGE